MDGWMGEGKELTVEMGMERVVVVRRVRARRDCVGVSWMDLKWHGEGKGKGEYLDGWHTAGGKRETRGFNLVKRVLGLQNE